MKILSFILLSIINIYICNSQSFIGIREKLGAHIPENIVLRNADSVEVNISTQINRPTLIAFSSFSCKGICNKMLEGISELIEQSELIGGDDYQVFSISTNHNDRPYHSRKLRSVFYKNNHNLQKNKFWHFYTGDSSTLHKLSDTLGYYYHTSGNKTGHCLVLIMLSPSARITRYMYGKRFLAPDFKMNINYALSEKPENTINRKLRYCYNYEPEGRHRLNRITSWSALSIVIIVFLFFSVLHFKSGAK